MVEQDPLHRSSATLAKQHAAVWLACALGIAGASLDAQGPPSYVSPEVGADRRITVRCYAPNAKSVVAAGELDGKPHPMTRGDNGVWSVTIGPLAPDIYTYAFNVDGVTALDPLNPNTKYGYGRFGAVSVVQVPGDGPQFYDVKPVPHGEVRIRPYVSKTLGVSRTAWVYTPPSYDKGSNFPVLYLLHGAGDIESGWTMIGRANNILDNAIAEGRARPMVVVMPLGHSIQSFWAGPAKQVPDPVMKAMAGATLNEIINAMMGGDGKGGLSPVTKDIVEDVMPMIEASYKVSKRPEDRAIAGLSMGGGHSINISFSRPELFRYVALMSPAAGGGVAPMYPRIAANPDILNKQFKMLWVGVGKDDTLTGPGDKAFSEALTKIGVKHEFVLTEGRHEWSVWRHYLNDIAPKLFR
jgi:enterochelin esterase-like enzyme